MNIFFFKNSISHAVTFLKEGPDNCAMWYVDGLSSYNELHKFVKVEKVFIESSIVHAFYKDNVAFVEKFVMTVINISEADENVDQPGDKICFFASNDTIVRSFKSVLDKLPSDAYKLFCRANENAETAAKQLGFNATPINTSVPNSEIYSLLVMGNDWGPREELINNQFLRMNRNTVCIQESSIDFNPRDRRMQQCSFPIFQGPATLENIDVSGRILAVIGNPRFEDLSPAPQNRTEFALVNVNFTYGIHEDIRDSWVEDVVSSCQSLGIDYILSQHPRDNGNLSKYKVLKSNPLLVHDSIRESSVVISRFSALLTEAICLGRPSIYYNPHNENMHYKFETDDQMLFHVHSKIELLHALERIRENRKLGNILDSSFLTDHLGMSRNGMASDFITKCLLNVSKFPPIKSSPSVLQRIILRGKIARRILTGNSY